MIVKWQFPEGQGSGKTNKGKKNNNVFKKINFNLDPLFIVFSNNVFHNYTEKTTGGCRVNQEVRFWPKWDESWTFSHQISVYYVDDPKRLHLQ